MKNIRELLSLFKNGEIDEEYVVNSLPFEDIDFAKLDLDRENRKGYPEIIFGQGKTPTQAASIFKSMASKDRLTLCTKSSVEIADAIMKEVPKAVYYEQARIVSFSPSEIKKKGLVSVVTAGTSDIGIAEEAAVVLEILGSNVDRIYDVGVAGLHRLLSQINKLSKANCIIAIAGMEGALPSVISGLVNVPVIAVPTSIGYGANQNGITTLLSMLCSCAEGVSVVNIDNGFGAAYQANMINKASVSKDID